MYLCVWAPLIMTYVEESPLCQIWEPEEQGFADKQAELTLEQHWIYQDTSRWIHSISWNSQRMSDMTPKIAKNMSGIDVGISFPKMLQAPSKGKFSSSKLGLAKRGNNAPAVIP